MNRMRGAVRRRAAPGSAQRGMVTVELAVGFLIAAVLTAGLAVGICLGATHSAAAAAAQQIALHTARGDTQAAHAARQEMPERSTVEITTDAIGVEVVVTAWPRLPGLGEVDLAARAWARWEPGVQR